MSRPFAASALILTALLIPVQATALSCARRPDPIQILNDARLRPDDVVVGYGSFSPGADLQASESHELVAGTAIFGFDGVMFQGGAIVPVGPAASVISTVCTHEIWCHGRAHPIVVDAAHLVVFDRAPSTGQLSVNSGLCGASTILSLPDLALERIAMCLADGSCVSADLR